jgi:hypothetical protein
MEAVSPVEDHEALLNWVIASKTIACESYGRRISTCNKCNLCELGNLLIGVIKLHSVSDWGNCVSCSGKTNETLVAFPCPTIEVFHKQLHWGEFNLQ